MAAMFKHITVVCFANICRTPVAEYLLQQASPDDVEIRSAGIQARHGYEAAEDMIEIMSSKDADITAHRSKLLDRAMVTWSELILVMETEHQKFIENKFPMARGRVQLLGKWTCGEIDDPYRQSREKYEACVVELEEAVTAWASKLWPSRVSCG